MLNNVASLIGLKEGSDIHRSHIRGNEPRPCSQQESDRLRNNEDLILVEEILLLLGFCLGHP